MVDAPDLKSVVRMGVGVQVPPLAPQNLPYKIKLNIALMRDIFVLQLGLSAFTNA